MTKDEALANIQGYAAAGRILFSPHARQRMAQRRIGYADVVSAIRNAKSCEAVPEDRWRVTGPDTDGDETDVICVLEDGVLVVTVY